MNMATCFIQPVSLLFYFIICETTCIRRKKMFPFCRWSCIYDFVQCFNCNRIL